MSLRIGSFSDVHLFHANTKTKFIIDNLNRHVSNPAFLATIQLLFLAGDLFDSGQDYGDDEVHAATMWGNRLLQLCARHGVVVRVLEGTTSHDRKQSKIFETLMSVGNYENLDCKYIDKLSVEYIDSLGIRVLYVPDEVNYDTAITEAQIAELLKAEEIEQVDYACMHGLFDFQVPEQLNPHIKFNSDYFQSIVKNLIFIGHDHTHQIKDRICVHGSFDRLRHEEEGPKGFVRAVVEDDGHFEIEFIENKTAKIYKTFRISGGDAEKALDMLAKQTKKMPDESHVRLILPRDHPLTQSLKSLKIIAPHVVWKVEVAKQKLKKLISSKESDSVRGPLIINNNTISELVRLKLRQQSVPEDLIHLAMEKLQKVI